MEMMITTGQAAMTVYGAGVVSKVNAKSVVVTVNGQDHKLTMKQYEIMNRGGF